MLCRQLGMSVKVRQNFAQDFRALQGSVLFLMRSRSDERWTQSPLTRGLGRVLADAFADAVHDTCSPLSQTILFCLGISWLEDWTIILSLDNIDQYLLTDMLSDCSAGEMGIDESL